MSSWIIFTDLDESLLDRENYSCEPARIALNEIRRRDIPLVLVTSKTAAETLWFQRRLDIDCPFAVEGGAGIYIPHNYFAKLGGTVVPQEAHDLLPLAASRKHVLRGLGHLKEFTANSIRGFDDMSTDEIARDTGLTLELAGLAKQREFDEPFKFVRREAEFAAHLSRIAREVGLRVTKGGRYYHLHGETDKGLAVHVLKSHFKAKLGPIRTIGLGDSEMDMPMLAETDVPILIPRPGGMIDPVLHTSIPQGKLAHRPGPEGWNLAILDVLGAS